MDHPRATPARRRARPDPLRAQADRLRRDRPGSLTPGASVPSVFTSCLASSATTHHAESDPQQCPENSYQDGVQPERPREAPPQEVETDILSVLDDENDECAAADNGCDRAGADLASWSLLNHAIRPISSDPTDIRRYITRHRVTAADRR